MKSQGLISMIYQGLLTVAFLWNIEGVSSASVVVKGQLSQDRIIGGTVTANHGRPYMALIKYSVQEDGQWYDEICGGNVVSEFWIVTAAHCMDGERYSLHLGMNSWCDTEGDPTVYSDGHVERQIRKTIVHPDFDSETWKNDIALIKMNEKVDLGDNIRTIKLPTHDPIEGNLMTVAGWGVTVRDVSIFSCALREVEVKVVSNATCMALIKNDVTHFCAGYEQGGKDSCQGDSGGGLVSTDANEFILDGLVSYGAGCGNPYTPAYYTRVYNYVSWINGYLST